MMKDIKDVFTLAKLVRPTQFTATPRFWDKLYEEYLLNVEENQFKIPKEEKEKDALAALKTSLGNRNENQIWKF